MLELGFDDDDAPLLINAQLRLRDERLIWLFHWWEAMRGADALPAWRDGHLQAIAFALDFVHVHRFEAESDLVRVQYVGSSLIEAVGEDPTGIFFSAERAPTENLKPTARRVFELVKLVHRLQAPLHARSKSARRLRGGNFMAENLHLPFVGANAEVEVVLAATIYTPVEKLMKSSGDSNQLPTAL